MTGQLAALLRSALDSTATPLVPLEQELKVVRAYLDIERVRFGDRLRVEIDIASDAWEAVVPPFVLQPLIENAVRHAIAPRESGGAITIEGARSGDVLRVSIVDDGPGVAEGSQSNGNGRIGLTNTRDRLRVLYGDRGQVALVNVPGGGTRATVEVPFRRR